MKNNIKDDYNQIYGEKDLIEQFKIGIKEGRKQALEEVMKIMDKWYSNWKNDEIQVFWREDLEELKSKIKQEMEK